MDIVSLYPKPPDFKSRIPPKPPSSSYSSFGFTLTAQETKEATKEEATTLEIPLYDTKRTDYKNILHELLDLLLVKYKDYLNGLLENSNELSNVFINLYFVLNGFRSVQGEQDLIDLLKDQVLVRKKLIEEGNALINDF